MPLVICPRCSEDCYGSTCSNCSYEFSANDMYKAVYNAPAFKSVSEDARAEKCQMCDSFGVLSTSTRKGGWYCKAHFNSAVRGSDEPVAPYKEYTIELYLKELEEEELLRINKALELIENHSNKYALNRVREKTIKLGKCLEKDYSSTELNKILVYLDRAFAKPSKHNI